MPVSRGIAVEARAGAAFELLIGLSVLCDARRSGERAWVPQLSECPAPVRRAVERVGDTTGETWLHLLGLALERQGADAAAFVDAVGESDELEFRRHLVGVYVPAWRSLVGAETLERAAAGQRAAAMQLLASERYYAGRARDALAVALPLTLRETKRRFVAALRRFLDVFDRYEASLTAQLEEDARRRRDVAVAASAEQVIAAATGGYIYEPEPEFRRVVLIPHLAAGPSLLLCQHRDARVICYPADGGPGGSSDLAGRLVRVGKALGEPARIAIVRRLVRGEASLTELAEAGGVAKSTMHHHLAALRAAGLVSVRGNARGYWYALRSQGFSEARSLLAELLEP
jgi:DNA-binding transcriptional ArsR family regulator